MASREYIQGVRLQIGNWETQSQKNQRNTMWPDLYEKKYTQNLWWRCHKIFQDTVNSVRFLRYFSQLKNFSPSNDIPEGSVKTKPQQTILAYLLL